MKKRIVVIQSFVILLLFIALAIIIVNPRNISERIIRKTTAQTQIFVKYGDTFSGFELTAYDGTTLNDIPKGKFVNGKPLVRTK